MPLLIAFVPPNESEPLGVADDGAVVLADGILLGPRGSLEQRVACCRELRAGGYAGPIVAGCTTVTEGEELLLAGADDFLRVPFTTGEVDVRVRAIARRRTASSRLQWGPLDVDQLEREVVVADGRTVVLTECECGILCALIEAAGAPVSRVTLRDRVSSKTPAGSNLVEVHVSRLRDKLGDEGALVETVRGQGYRVRR